MGTLVPIYHDDYRTLRPDHSNYLATYPKCRSAELKYFEKLLFIKNSRKKKRRNKKGFFLISLPLHTTNRAH